MSNTKGVEYERNQRTMHRNGGNFNRDESVAGVRAGHGLLTGLLRCARCGRKLHIRYWGKSGTAARYLGDGDDQIGGQYCLGVGGATVDKRVGEAILNVISPLGIKAGSVFLIMLWRVRGYIVRENI